MGGSLDKLRRKMPLAIVVALLFGGCVSSHLRTQDALGEISAETSEFIQEHRRAPRDRAELAAFAKSRSVKLDFRPFSKISFTADTGFLPSFTYEVIYQVRGQTGEESMMGSMIACVSK